MSIVRRKIKVVPVEESISSAQSKWERELCKIIHDLDTAISNRIIQIPDNYETQSEEERELQHEKRQQQYRDFCKAKQEARVFYLPFEQQIKWYMNYV